MNEQGTLQPVTMGDGAVVDVYQVPARGTRRGAIVLIQEIFGLTAHVREQCDQLAEQGFEVWAPAIFDRQAPGLQLSYAPQDIETAMTLVRAHPFAVAVADAQRCIELLSVSGPVFITGYCYGGSVSWAVACRTAGLSGASCYYGSAMPGLAEEVPRCPVIAHFGEFDSDIPLPGVKHLAALRPEATIHIYPARHGFASDRREDYHAQSAALARTRTLALFNLASEGRA